MVIRLKPEYHDAYLELHRTPDTVVMQEQFNVSQPDHWWSVMDEVVHSV